MINRRTLLSVLIIILLAATLAWWLMNRGTKFMPATVTSSNGSHYALQLPDQMEPGAFDDNASLQYSDPDRDLYTVVIDESKAKIISFGLDYDLETYMKIATRQLDSAGMYVNKPIEINGYKALQTEIKKKLKDKTVVYRLTCIETPKFFYQLLVWTSEDRYEDNKADIGTIIGSFREVQK